MMWLWLMLGCPGPEAPSPWRGLVINEVLSANDSVVTDPANAECPEHDDFVELVNHGTRATTLADVRLVAGSDTFVVPAQELGPGEHLLIWADGQPEQGPLHADFGISRDGERLELWRGDLRVDVVEVPPNPGDRSWARVADGAADWVEAHPPTPGASNQRELPDDPCFAPRQPFDDHTYPCITDADGYRALAGPRTDLAVVKFDIFHFQDPSRRHVRFMDSTFYSLHDQYYLFTVLNGEPFELLGQYAPYAEGDFRTWAELDQWARSFPLDSRFDPHMVAYAGERLFSRYFYEGINGDDRAIGVGTIVHREGEGGAPDFWGFELEYSDEIVYDDLVVYFEVLADQGNPELAQVHWLVRSPAQEALAQRMEADDLPYADRVTRYGELAQPGEVEVYHPGLTAGRVRRIRAGEGGWEALRSTDIVIADEIPDELPPCAAFLTSVPQTPLSHIALLAQSRGIPNAYVAGITSDAEWDAWSRRTTRIALEATDEGLRTRVLTYEDYLLWQDLQQENTPALSPVSTTTWAVDLATAGDMIDLRPLVGGKAAGMRQLLLTPGLDAPDTPLGLTVRGYEEHLAMVGDVPALLAAYPFDDDDEALARAAVLLGEQDFLALFPEGAATLATVLATAEGRWAAELAAGDGLMGAVAGTPMPASVAAALAAEVDRQFAWLDPDQGLRFRSSSTVEDIEGFNGAGLYTSATGWRNGASDARTVEEAIRLVWASYWGPQAYEERAAAGIDHLAGRMGVLVHPRFDDEQELSNGVMVATLGPDGAVTVEVNVQDGDVSVVNPPNTCPAVLPERSVVTASAIERVAASTEVDHGEQVLSDAQLRALYDQSTEVLDGWLAAENDRLPAEEARGVLTLDLEMREMDAGWPRGSTAGPRLVVKQARSLEPSAAGLPDEVQALPAPRDVLARAARVERWSCDADEAWVVYTNPRLPPDLGYAEVPFAVELVADGQVFGHLDGLVVDGHDVNGVDVGCAAETLWASPDELLLGWLDDSTQE